MESTENTINQKVADKKQVGKASIPIDEELIHGGQCVCPFLNNGHLFLPSPLFDLGRSSPSRPAVSTIHTTWAARGRPYG